MRGGRDAPGGGRGLSAVSVMTRVSSTCRPRAHAGREVRRTCCSRGGGAAAREDGGGDERLEGADRGRAGDKFSTINEKGSLRGVDQGQRGVPGRIRTSGGQRLQTQGRSQLALDLHRLPAVRGLSLDFRFNEPGQVRLQGARRGLIWVRRVRVHRGGLRFTSALIHERGHRIVAKKRYWNEFGRGDVKI